MRRVSLEAVLRRALLLASPMALGACAQSSCPDDGYEPPAVSEVQIDAALGAGGPLSADDCRVVCDSAAGGDELLTCVRQDATTALCIKAPYPCEGRRPAGLQSAVRRVESGQARHLADAAWLEAASVEAFQLLRSELCAHGAPRRLLRQASRSARDERRHARASRALARRFGVSVPAVERGATASRSLAELALENAVEGCVRETWGALLAAHQAECAADLEVRAVMARIAPDERRHAELARRVARWLEPRLSPQERVRVRAARRAAAAQLRDDLSYELASDERARLGLPDAAAASRMLRELDRSLGWSQ